MWLENRLYLSLFWIALLTLLLVPVWQLTTNNDDWLPPDHPQSVHLDYLNDEFISGEDLVIAFRYPNGFFNYQALTDLSRLEQSLKNHLGDVLIFIHSPLTSIFISGSKGTVEIGTFAQAFHRGEFKTIADYKKAFDESPYAGRLISLDYKIATLYLRLDTNKRVKRLRRAMQKVRRVLAYEGFDDYHLISRAALKDQMNRQTNIEFNRFIIIAALILILFLWLALGRLRQSLLVLGMASICVMGSLSVIVLFGHHMTAVTLVLPILAAVIAIAHGLHILAHHENFVAQHPDLSPALIAKKTIAYIWWPCFFANLTTAIGFGSFIVSGLVPLKNFGWDAAGSMVLLYITVVSGFWYIFRWHTILHRSERNHVKKILKKVLSFCHRFSEAHKVKICLATFLLAIGLGAGLTHFHTETNFLPVFFKPDSKIRKDFNLADQQLGGSGAVDIIIRNPDMDHFKKIEVFDATHRLAARLAAHPKVNYAEAIDIPVQLTHHAFTENLGLPDQQNMLSQELFFLELSRDEKKSDVLSLYVNFDYTASRIHLRTPDLSSNDIDALLADIRTITVAEESFGEIILTGFNVFIHSLSTEILTTQIKSLLLTAVFIFTVFIIIFGWHVGALGFASNIFPVMMMLGIISWVGAPFDITTILVASITLGLAVDDSIHFLHAWRHERQAGASGVVARHLALQHTGGAIILTSLLFCVGFSVFLISDLALLVKFGAFTIIGLALDMISSVLFLPALLAFMGPRDID